jgi:DNA N-6-adenine-methyltransferase (Dam)
VSQLTLLVGPLGGAEARRLTDEVKRDAQPLWTKVMRLWLGQAHIALGYGSWGAYMDAEFSVSSSHAYRLLDAARVEAALRAHSPNGERLPTREAHARELAPLLREQGKEALLEVWRELLDEFGEAVTAAKIKSIVGERLRRERVWSVMTSSESVEWYTPPLYMKAVRKVLGRIDLDPASCEAANATVGADRFFAAEDDGLAHEWRGRVWLNPPYGRSLTGRFVGKLLEEHGAGRVEAAIAVLNGYSFDAAYFQPLFNHPLCFTNHRIPFVHADGRVGGSIYASVFVYLGDEPMRFADVFSRFGNVVVRMVDPDVEDLETGDKHEPWENQHFSEEREEGLRDGEDPHERRVSRAGRGAGAA